MSDIRCRLGLNFRSLVYEAERLLLAYFDLDTRIRPLVDAIIMFTMHHKINEKLEELHTYSYCILVLHFLLHGFAKPLIPCPHDNIRCNINYCLYNAKSNNNVFLYVHGKFERISLAPYHSCVKIVNNVTNAYSPPSFSGNAKQQLWYSNNDDNYSVKSHFKKLSITDKYMNERFLKKYNQCVLIQHPLRFSENAGKRCTEEKLDKIVETFAAAKRMLETGSTFKDICKN